MKIVSTDPLSAPQMPATAGSVASAFLKNGQWMPVDSLPSFSSASTFAPSAPREPSFAMMSTSDAAGRSNSVLAVSNSGSSLKHGRDERRKNAGRKGEKVGEEDRQQRPHERAPDARNRGIGGVGVLEEWPVDAGRQLAVLLQRIDRRAERAARAFLRHDVDLGRGGQVE